ncbi:MAG: hypothetical protein ACREHD_16275, partial [Pirellulales bacterium]
MAVPSLALSAGVVAGAAPGSFSEEVTVSGPATINNVTVVLSGDVQSSVQNTFFSDSLHTMVNEATSLDSNGNTDVVFTPTTAISLTTGNADTLQF